MSEPQLFTQSALVDINQGKTCNSLINRVLSPTQMTVMNEPGRRLRELPEPQPDYAPEGFAEDAA